MHVATHKTHLYLDGVYKKKNFGQPVVSIKPHEYSRYRDFLRNLLGFELGSDKRSLIEQRIGPRVKQLDLGSFDAYLNYIRSKKQGALSEKIAFIDRITTNTTRFFRESRQFNLLTDRVLPELIDRGKTDLSIWSAGSSTGEEVYTLAMVLDRFKHYEGGLGSFRIYGNDVSHSVIKSAKIGIYPREAIRHIPTEYARKYIQKGSGRYQKYIRFDPKLKRRHTDFWVQNLMEDGINLSRKADIIFCRNTMIYFTRQVRQKLVYKFARYLKPGGYLFISFTESLSDLQDIPFNQVNTSIYQLKGG